MYEVLSYLRDPCGSSQYYYVVYIRTRCVLILILLDMCPLEIRSGVCFRHTVCVLVLILILLDTCPHTAIYVSFRDP